MSQNKKSPYAKVAKRIRDNNPRTRTLNSPESGASGIAVSTLCGCQKANHEQAMQLPARRA